MTTAPIQGSHAPVPVHVLHVGRAPWPHVDGVEQRPWASLDVELPSVMADRPVAAGRDGLALLDVSALAWADALVLRDWYATVPACLGCDVVDTDDPDLAGHAGVSGHPWRRAYEASVRLLVEAADGTADPWRGRALVYALTLEDGQGAPAGAWPGPASELDLARRMARLATAVVVRGEAGASLALALGAPASRIVRAATPDLFAAAARAAARAADAQAFDRRMALRAADAEAAAVMHDRWAAGLPAWEDPGEDALVSALVPVVDEPVDLVGRAIASALASEGGRLEILVAGSTASAAAAAAAAASDARVRLVTVPAPDPAGEGAVRREQGRAIALRGAIREAQGAWLALLEPEAVWVPEHPAALVGVAREHGLDLVYGRALLVAGGEAVDVTGEWPPRQDAVPVSTVVLSRRLGAFAPDPDAPAAGEGGGWNMVRRCIDAGARVANADAPLALLDVATRHDALRAVLGGRLP